MPPKTSSVDGISKTAVAPQPQVPDSNPNVDQNANLKPIAAAPNPKAPKDSFKATKNNTSQTVIVFITVVVMVVLIGLAYFAYHKSR